MLPTELVKAWKLVSFEFDLGSFAHKPDERKGVPLEQSGQDED
jgi:hypothetical protein